MQGGLWVAGVERQCRSGGVGARVDTQTLSNPKKNYLKFLAMHDNKIGIAPK